VVFEQNNCPETEKVKKGKGIKDFFLLLKQVCVFTETRVSACETNEYSKIGHILNIFRG